MWQYLCWSAVNVGEDWHPGALGLGQPGQPAGAGCVAKPGLPGQGWVSAASPGVMGSSLNHSAVQEQIAS